MSKTYPIGEDGEWWEPPLKNFRLQCCQCGLVHLINFRVVNGKIQFQMFRDNRATGQVQRHMKKTEK